MNYENCQFKDLDKLDVDDLNFYITTGLFISPDPWGMESITELSYGKVMELVMMFEKEINLPDIATIIMLCSGKKCATRLWHTVFAHYNWIANEVKRVEEMLKNLYVAPTNDEEQAGIDSFAEFGAFTTIDRLAGGDPLKYDAIEAMPFDVIFAKLRLNKVTYQYEENLRMIWEAKNRGK